jgi:hypothetical protein
VPFSAQGGDQLAAATLQPALDRLGGRKAGNGIRAKASRQRLHRLGVEVF